MLRGGISDKLGNGYEAFWTLNEALRVLLGQADEIRPEPFNEDAKALEFRLSAKGVDEWHQCKRRRSDGSWSIKNLADEDILQAFARKLALQNSKCVFVSSDPSPAFETLIEKAKIAEKASDFYDAGSLGKADHEAIAELRKTWQEPPETIFDWLKRCRVTVVSDASLRQQVLGFCQILFRTSPETAVNQWLGFLGDNLGKRLTTDGLRSAVPTLGLDWAVHLDDTLDAKFAAATDEYLNLLPRKIAGTDLPVVDLDATLTTALSGNPPITIVAGGAGSGKSVVVSRTIAKARENGWPALAFRIDRYLEARTLKQLGKEILDHDSSPVAAFGSRNADRPSLLVIDQVDAVSEASGRSALIRDLFFKMIEECSRFPQMRVVAACRSYDLDRDTRLTDMSKAKRVTTVQLKPMDWETIVRPLLAKLKVDESKLTSRSKETLRTPINLQLFASIVEAGEQAEGELSGAKLFDKLVDIRERENRAHDRNWTVMQALTPIAQYMSENQELTAPAAILDAFSGASDFLSSAGLIAVGGSKVQFAHESFFDHTFSRHFSTSGQTVHSLLVSDEQRLFRRTQVRQIFSRLRDTGGRKYLQNLREVMEAGDVRYLIKDAIAYWLSKVDDPISEELKLIAPWLSPGHAFDKLGRIIVNGPAWLPLLLSSGALDRMVREGGDRKGLAFWLLQKGAVAHQEVVARYLDAWWRQNVTGRSKELISWFEDLHANGRIHQLEDLYAAAIAMLPASEIEENFEANFELGIWVHNGDAMAARILGHWLKAWMAAFPAQHPFSKLGHQRDEHSVTELARDYPLDLLEAMVPAYAEALKREDRAIADGTLTYRTISPPHYDHNQPYLKAVVQAFANVATTHPDRAIELLDLLGDETDVAIFARLKTITANGERLNSLLIPLLSRKRTFRIGEGRGDWKPFADAAAAAMPHLDAANRTKVEDAVAAHRPEYDRARQCAKDSGLRQRLSLIDKDTIRQLTLTGTAERAILRTIDPAVLSEKARLRLAELDRKFVGLPLPESLGVRVGWIKSPIALEKARLMSDAQWIAAMRKYDNGREQAEPHRLDFVGGAQQLAQVLRGCVKDAPERFVALLENLPLDVRSEYPEALVGGLDEAETTDDCAARAIKAALCWPRTGFGRTISWLVKKHPSTALDDPVIAFLLIDAIVGTASDTMVTTTHGENDKKPKETAAQLLNSDRDLADSGINSDRGVAYEALAAALWDYPQTLSVIVTLLQNRIDSEPLASVMMCMVSAINAVARYEPDLALTFLRRLIARDPRIIDGHATSHILHWAIHTYPDLISDVADLLLSADQVELVAKGHYWKTLLALVAEGDTNDFVATFSASSLRRQIVAYVAAQHAASPHDGNRARRWLVPFFNDDNDLVRADATHVDWDEVLDSDEDLTDFVRAYVASPAFDTNFDPLIMALENRVSRFPGLTFAALDRIFELSGGWTTQSRQRRFTTFHHLSQLIVALYRCVSSGGEEERKCLDFFDTYLALGNWEMRREIDAYDRH